MPDDAGAGPAASARLIAIAGPSGSGKTTIVRALSQDHVALLEDIVENPHLDALLTGAPTFDAHANQRWFLDRVERFLGAANPQQTTVLDQDPGAIVRGYARLFLDQQQLSASAYRSLLLDLGRVELLAGRWRGGRVTIFLDAPAATLRRRAELRGDAKLPDEEWFRAVRGYFVELHAEVPASLVIATGDLTVEQTLEAVREAIAAHA